MELAWIDDFLALAQTRNFTRAAEMRCTTQSAYSRRVQRLEEWLGASLLDRDTRPVALTPAGEEFLKRAQRLREEIFDARRAVLSASSVFKKSQRVYTTNTLAATMLSAWIAESGLENYSLIVASISGCLDAVRRRHADVALVPHFGEDAMLQGLAIEEVAEDHLILVGTPRVNARVALQGKKLTGPIMVYAPGTSYGAQISAMLARRQIAIAEAPVCESASAEALLAQAKAGLGAAWTPRLLLVGEKLKRCDVPSYFDVAYKIVLARPL
jgi:DNA-binding transcriptional LysR family regulator